MAPLSFYAYRALSRLVFDLASPLLPLPEPGLRAQKRGRLTGLPSGGLWVHAVSVGEVKSAAALGCEMQNRRPALEQVVSTVTTTGGQMCASLMPWAHHCYAPWDSPGATKRALEALSPRAYVVCETELWPNMLQACVKAKVLAFLVNGRVSDHSFERYSKMSALAGYCLNSFEKVFARGEADANRFLALGLKSEKLVVCGEGKVDTLRARMVEGPEGFAGDRPTFLAGSTHEGEEKAVKEAWAAVRDAGFNPRLIIAPRHPERVGEVKALFAGEKVCTYSAPSDDWDVMIVDQIGPLFRLYGGCTGAFVGGSLVKKGCQNLYEPALWGVPFAFGPSYEDFREPGDALIATGLARVVAHGPDLAAFWLALASGTLDLTRAREDARRWIEGLPTPSRLWAEGLCEYC